MLQSKDVFNFSLLEMYPFRLLGCVKLTLDLPQLMNQQAVS